MTPMSRIFLARLAHTESNAILDNSIPDAPLTPLGKKQSASLAYQIPKLQEEVDLVVTSPLKRTLQTTRLGWAPAIDRLGGLFKVICITQAQECNAWPCDTGSMKETRNLQIFDFSRLTLDWTSKQDFYAIDIYRLNQRAQWVRQFLRDRPEENIVLVAHGGRLPDDLKRAGEALVVPMEECGVQGLQLRP